MKDNPSILISVIKAYLSANSVLANVTTEEIEFCTQFGLGPILADLYLEGKAEIQADIASKLQSIKVNARYFSAVYHSAVKELIDLLSESGVNIILLKGIHLSESYYQYRYHRLMGDIDILVNKENISEVVQVLSSLGYEQEGHLPDEFFLLHQHLKPFHQKEKDIWLELHTRLFSKKAQQGKRLIYQPENIFKNLTHLTTVGNNAYCLNPELNLHYTITHWVREFKISNSLIQIVDIALLIQNNTIDWKKFIASIETLSHATEIKVVLDLLDRNDLIDIPKDVKDRIFQLNDSAGVLGRWVMRKIINGYLEQNNFITNALGRSFCISIWEAHLRDKNCIFNQLYAIYTVIFAEVPGSDSRISSFWIRLKRFYLRLINRL